MNRISYANRKIENIDINLELNRYLLVGNTSAVDVAAVKKRIDTLLRQRHKLMQKKYTHATV